MIIHVWNFKYLCNLLLCVNLQSSVFVDQIDDDVVIVVHGIEKVVATLLITLYLYFLVYLMSFFVNP